MPDANAVLFFPTVDRLEPRDYPKGLDLEEAELEERAMHFAARPREEGAPCYMFGPVEVFGDELANVLPADETLLLGLEAHSTLQVTDADDCVSSIFGEHRFFVLIKTHALEQRRLEDAWVQLEAGT